LSTLLRNTSWIVFATTISKVLAIIAQIILGFYLVKESFGIYAFALGLTTIFIWLKNGALTQLIVKKSLNSKYVNADYINYQQLFNFVSSLGLMIIAALYWGTSLSFIVFTFAIYQIFSTPSLLVRVHCTQQHNYKQLALYQIGQGFIRNSVLIVAAIYFQDETAFAYSLIAVILYDIITSRVIYQIPIYIFPKSIKVYRMKRIFIHGKWLLLGALASTFVMQGSFAIIGTIMNETLLGVYFFAFQLVAVISILVGEAIRKVLMPSFVTITSFQLRNERFHEVVKIGIVFLVPISFHMMMGVDPVLKLIWGIKWLDAIGPGMVMAVIIFFPILIVISYSLLEANNEWKKRNLMQLADALVLLLSSIIGALSGSLITLALVIASGRVVSAIIQIIIVYRKYSFGLYDFFKTLILVIGINVLVALVILCISKYFILSDFENLLVVVLSFIIYMSFIYSMYKNRGLKRS
jgi:O-antigen/teichoic acid export membrane protein